jgi:hypothetical protein
VTHDQPKHSPRWQGLTHTGKTNDAGISIPGDPIIINCHGHTQTGICTDCAESLARVLADVPLLLDDLDIAISGATRFVEHGASETRNPDRTGSHPAIAAQQRLTTAMTAVADWFDDKDPTRLADQLSKWLDRLAGLPPMPRIARNISQAASKAHKIIDAPAELWYYGPCPSCERDLWQERIHHEDTKTPIVCRFPSCDYAAPLDVHNRKALEVGHDRLMTIDELVGAIASGGIPITREQIKGWIYRDGLPREKRNRPRYVDGELHQNEVWTYRLGDVLDCVLRVEAKRNRAVS